MFSASETLPTLVTYTFKSFIELTSGFIFKSKSQFSSGVYLYYNLQQWKFSCQNLIVKIKQKRRIY